MGHIARDCNQRNNPEMANQARERDSQLDSEYMNLMAELGESVPGSEANRAVSVLHYVDCGQTLMNLFQYGGSAPPTGGNAAPWQQPRAGGSAAPPWQQPRTGSAAPPPWSTPSANSYGSPAGRDASPAGQSAPWQSGGYNAYQAQGYYNGYGSYGYYDPSQAPPPGNAAPWQQQQPPPPPPPSSSDQGVDQWVSLLYVDVVSQC
ncbi:hypothetical protein G6F42_026646 [Rhizopus arrhizus]|nr:hypothetical protein G6F42_026646 [Rhizopus arrhizus]